jgi:O-antigen ligase
VFLGALSELRFRKVSKLLPAIIVLVPLLIAPGLTLSYDVIPRLAVFEFLLCAMLLCWPAWLAGVRQAAASRWGRAFLAISAATAVWIVLCALTSTDPRLAFYGSSWRALGAITWCSILVFGIIAAGALLQTPRLIQNVSRAAAVSGIVGAGYGILQYFGIDPLLPRAAYHAGEGAFQIVRPPGTLGHADYFSLWLVAVFFLAIPLAQDEKHLWQWLGYAAQAASAIAIVLSGTRASLIGLIAGAIALAVMLRPRIGLKHLAAFMLPVVLGVVFFISPAGAPLRARVHWSLDEPAGGARLLLWRDSLRMAAARPTFGFGPEQYSSEFPRFESLQLARQYPDWYHESPHNALLDAATSTGLVGFALTLALFALGFVAAWSARRVRPIPSAAVVAGLLAQFVNLQFISLTLSGAVFLLLFIALGVSLAPSRTAEPAALHRWIVIPAGAAAMVFALYATRLLACDILLGQFDREIAQGRPAAAVSSYQNARRWSPSGAAGDLYCSRRLLSIALRSPHFEQRLDVLHNAILAAANAVRTGDDRQNAWYNLAIVSATESDDRNVERCLREASAISPNWFKPHWTLARLLAMEGRHAEARAQARTALALDAGHHPEVAQTLQQANPVRLQSFYGPPTTVRGR